MAFSWGLSGRTWAAPVGIRVVLLASVALCGWAGAFEVPSVDLESVDGATARQALGSVGALAVGVEGLAEARAAAFSGLAECLASTREVSLGDGATRRTAGGGFENGVAPHALRAGSGGEGPDCGANAAALRSLVLAAAREVANAVDGGPRGLGGRLRRNSARSPSYESLVEVVDRGQHLEQLHSYASGSGLALPAHVDAGVLVAMVAGPLGDARSAAAVSAELPNGESAVLEWDDTSSVLFLVGDGARWFDWDVEPPLRPAPHALDLSLADGDARAWYGLMVLPPNDALVFGDRYDAYRARAVEQAGAGVGCGAARTDEASRALSAPDVEACKTQGGADGILCWLQCLEVDCDGNAAAACVDIETGDVVAGDEHCPHHGSCEPVCLDADGSLPANFTARSDEGFCIGEGQDMHMDGFRSGFEKHAPACVNLYFTTLTLNRAWKYAGGVFLSFLVGVFVEVISKARRRLFAARKAARHAMDAERAKKLTYALVAAHQLQVVVGYLAMFAAMTYAVELFVAVCLGATVGYVLFHMDEAPAGTDPCCKGAAPDDGAPDEESKQDGHDRASKRAVVAPDDRPPPCCDGF